jgi:hypothetical protein
LYEIDTAVTQKEKKLTGSQVRIDNVGTVLDSTRAWPLFSQAIVWVWSLLTYDLRFQVRKDPIEVSTAICQVAHDHGVITAGAPALPLVLLMGDNVFGDRQSLLKTTKTRKTSGEERGGQTRGSLRKLSLAFPPAGERGRTVTNVCTGCTDQPVLRSRVDHCVRCSAYIRDVCAPNETNWIRPSLARLLKGSW